MTPLQEIKRLDAFTPKREIKKIKPRRLRRQEARDQIKFAKNKNG